MTKHERIYNLLDGKKIDRTPAGFWLHFPKEMHHDAAAIQAHMNFMKDTDTDILKIMNENILYDGETIIETSADIDKFRGFCRKDKIFQDQMKIISCIKEQAKGEYPLLTTIHGLLASTFHETGFEGFFATLGGRLAEFSREKPAQMHHVFETVAETLMEFVDCSLEAGADGIFYAALGGERHFFTDDEFTEFVAPYEKKIYDHIKAATPFNVLHICKTDINFNRFIDLKPAIVNWGIYGNHLSLTEGAELFPESIILGGFPDRYGVMVDGTRKEIFDHTRKVLDEMKGKRFIVGSDCTLPTEISHERIHTVVEALEEMKF